MPFQKQNIKLKAIGIIVLFLWGLTGCWGYGEYMAKLACYHSMLITQKVAKKDSIKAVQSDNTVKNLVHPEAVIKDTANGYTYLKIKTTALSDKELPALVDSTTSTDSNQIFRTETAAKEVKYNKTISSQLDSITVLNKTINSLVLQADSLYNVLFSYNDKYLSIAQVRTPIGKRDSIAVQHHYTAVIYPDTHLGKRRFLGLAQWDTTLPKHTKSFSEISLISPDTNLVFAPDKKSYDLYLYNPVFAVALQGTTNYNPSTHSWQVGPGVRIFYKGFNIYVPYYYNFTQGRFNNSITFSLSKTLVRWQYTPKR